MSLPASIYEIIYDTESDRIRVYEDGIELRNCAAICAFRGTAKAIVLAADALGKHLSFWAGALNKSEADGLITVWTVDHWTVEQPHTVAAFWRGQQCGLCSGGQTETGCLAPQRHAVERCRDLHLAKADDDSTVCYQLMSAEDIATRYAVSPASL